MQLHVVTDGKKTKEKLVEILSAIHPYVDFIHIREKERSAKELMGILEALLEKGVPPRKLLLNDRVDVAFAKNIGGVQLAFHSMEVSQVRSCFSTLVIGSSVHSYLESIKAEMDGADFVLYGHIYATSSKKGLKPKGLSELRTMTRLLRIPVIAIGGITPDRLIELKSCGVGGVAVMSGIMDAEDYVKAAQIYRQALRVEREEIL